MSGRARGARLRDDGYNKRGCDMSSFVRGGVVDITSQRVKEVAIECAESDW